MRNSKKLSSGEQFRMREATQESLAMTARTFFDTRPTALSEVNLFDLNNSPLVKVRAHTVRRRRRPPSLLAEQGASQRYLHPLHSEFAGWKRRPRAKRAVLVAADPSDARNQHSSSAPGGWRLPPAQRVHTDGWCVANTLQEISLSSDPFQASFMVCMTWRLL